MERAKGRREGVQRSIGDMRNEKAVQKLAVKKSGKSPNVNLLIFCWSDTFIGPLIWFMVHQMSSSSKEVPQLD